MGVVEVQKLFSLLSGDKLVGLVGDQSPYYPFITSGSGPPRQARLLNPKKSVITFLVQGLNSGLMLFQLGKMRESVEYKSELDAAKMEELSNRFVPTVQDDNHQDKNGSIKEVLMMAQVPATPGLESRRPGLVLPPLLVEAPPGGNPPLPVQRPPVQHH